MHALMFSADAAADRAFLRDVLGFPYVDDGDGWLIFKLPPSEVGVHPADGGEPSPHPHLMVDQSPEGGVPPPGGGEPSHQLYLMVDDIAAAVADFRAKGVPIVAEPADRGFGVL